MISILICHRRFLILSSLVASLLTASFAHADDAEDDRDLCRKNLTNLFNAIQSYRADHKDVPGWLSDLIPKYLRDPNALVCPTVKRTGNFNSLATEDPKIATTYSYQFSDGPIPKVVPGGAGYTMKEWKRRQMGLVGSKVPMIRCHNHGRVLNVNFDGRLFESEGAWENALKSEIDISELYPTKIFSREAVLVAATKAQSSIMARSSSAATNLIDLSRHYNAALSESWNPITPNGPPAHNVGAMPHGVQRFDGIDFDVRGRIQLSSKKLTQARYPQDVKNIEIGQKASELHFLHGAGWTAPPGTRVCDYVIHFENGKTDKFTARYGDHIIDWTKPPELRDEKAATVAWSGPSPASPTITLSIYKTHWTNPHPDQTITSIDFISANSDPAPFLIAITAETATP